MKQGEERTTGEPKDSGSMVAVELHNYASYMPAILKLTRFLQRHHNAPFRKNIKVPQLLKPSANCCKVPKEEKWSC